MYNYCLCCCVKIRSDWREKKGEDRRKSTFDFLLEMNNNGEESKQNI